MKKILTILLVVAACINYSSAVAQQIKKEQNDLQGEMELTIDVSDMKDTVGRFMVYVGGERFYPEIKNNILTVRKLMQEPRRVFLAFYPTQKIKANPDKALNKNTAAELYHVHSIPANFLIDESGKIIATHLYEEELNGHLEKLLE